MAVGAVCIWSLFSTAAVAQPPVLSGPDVVRYADPITDFSSSKLRVYQGTLTFGGGCVISGELEAGPDQPTAAVEEVAFDPVGCRSLVRTGRLASSEEVESVEPGSQTEDAQAAAGCPVDECGTETRGGGGPGRYRAEGSSAWEEPAQLDTSKALNVVEWASTGTCVIGARVRSRTSWLVATGWNQTSKANNFASDCNSALSSTKAKFENRRFCSPAALFFPTRTAFRPNGVRAFPSGRARHRWVADKSGPCSQLLSFQQRLNWTDLDD